MEVTKITENEDGSATLELNLTEEENNILIGYAVNDILKKNIENFKQDNKKRCFKCNNIIDVKTLKDFPDTEVCLECIKDS